jgi:hypothetical protein
VLLRLRRRHEDVWFYLQCMAVEQFPCPIALAASVSIDGGTRAGLRVVGGGRHRAQDGKT